MAGAVSQHFDSFKGKLDKTLHEKNSINDILAKVEQKTGVRRLYIVLGLLGLLGVYLMVGYGAQFLCNFIGFVYPAYCSFKAIESTRKDDDTQWLMYWVVYAFFAVTEFFADIFFFWIPFYWFFKCCFLVYCFAPAPWNGSEMIYKKVIRPVGLRYQTKVDKTIDEVSDVVKEVISTSTTTSQSIGDGEIVTSNTASASAGGIDKTTHTSKTTSERIDVAMISSDTTPESICNKTATSSNTTSEGHRNPSKPTWNCDACKKKFVGKVGLQKHWKRYPEHKTNGNVQTPAIENGAIANEVASVVTSTVSTEGDGMFCNTTTERTRGKARTTKETTSDSITDDKRASSSSTSERTGDNAIENGAIANEVASVVTSTVSTEGDGMFCNTTTERTRGKARTTKETTSDSITDDKRASSSSTSERTGDNGVNFQVKNEDSSRPEDVTITLRRKNDEKVQVRGGKGTSLLKAIESNSHFKNKNSKEAYLMPLTKTNCKGIPNLGIPLHLLADEEFSIEFPFKLKVDDVLHCTTIPSEKYLAVMLIHVDINQNKMIVKRGERHSHILTVPVVMGQSLYEAFYYDGRFKRNKLQYFKLEEEYKSANWRSLDVNDILCPVKERYKNILLKVKSTGRTDLYKDHSETIEQLVGTKSRIESECENPSSSKNNEPEDCALMRLKIKKPESLKQFTKTVELLFENDRRKKSLKLEEKLRYVEEQVRKLTGFQKLSLDRSHLSGALLFKLSEYQKAVCRISYGSQPLGVGWHVGQGFIITNYHVVYQSLFEYNGFSLEQMQVSFDYNVGSDRGFLYNSIPKANYPLQYSVVPRVYQHDGSVTLESDGTMTLNNGFDYAILKLHVKSIHDIHNLPFVSPSDFHVRPDRGSQVHIIGWPGNLEKRLVDLNCVILGPDHEERVGRASFFAKFPGRTYNTMMLQGSSGSLVIDDEGRPVLLHHGGMMNEIKTVSLYEEGMCLQAIKKHIIESEGVEDGYEVVRQVFKGVSRDIQPMDETD